MLVSQSIDQLIGARKSITSGAVDIVSAIVEQLNRKGVYIPDSLISRVAANLIVGIVGDTRVGKNARYN